MTEIFKPRANMTYDGEWEEWQCHDKNGNLICDGGPSQIWDDNQRWQFWISGIGRHRLDGPANSWGSWYFYGKNVTDKIHQFAEENSIDLENLSDEDKILIALTFG